jgi:hypothetical protein
MSGKRAVLSKVILCSETLFMTYEGLGENFCFQADSFHKFNSIPAFIIPQSENISTTNGRVVMTLCMSE